MKNITYALFKNSDEAGRAISILKEKGYTKDISLVAKDEDTGKVKSKGVKKDVSEGAVVGGVTGAAIGAVAAAIGLSLNPVTLPALGVVLSGGPLSALLGGVGGAVSGGLVGALVDAGVPEEEAKIYEDRIKRGEVLVAVTSDMEHRANLETIFKDHRASKLSSYDAA